VPQAADLIFITGVLTLQTQTRNVKRSLKTCKSIRHINGFLIISAGTSKMSFAGFIKMIPAKSGLSGSTKGYITLRC
jgi:hypothetical protein